MLRRDSWTPNSWSGCSYIAPDIDDEAFIAAAIYRWLRAWPATASSAWDIPGGWRLGEHAGWTIRLGGGERTDHVHIVGTPQRAEVWVEGGKPRPLAAEIRRRAAGS